MPTPSSQKTICVFACRWCALLGAERAGRERLPLPPAIRLMPVPCAGGVSLDAVVQAFAAGADGVAVLGCHLGGCRHNDANRDAHARLAVLADLLATVGVDSRRLLISWGTAHEAGQYAALVNAFAAQLRDARPLPEFFQCPGSQAEAQAPMPPAEAVPAGLARNAPGQDAELQAQAARVLEKGHALLALARVGDAVIPGLFTTSGALTGLVAWPKYPMAKLAGAMLRERARHALMPQGPHQALRAQAFALRDKGLGVACRPCDARALYQMADLRQFPRETLELVPIACSAEQQAACRCQRFHWPGTEQARELLPEEDGGAGGVWREHFSRCVQCHWCRSACPVCVCPACVLDDPASMPSGEETPSPLAYHLARALHVSDACAQCGACQDVCPQGLPLLELHQTVARSLSRQGYLSGEGMASPLRAGRCKTAAPQWLSSLKGGLSA